MRFLFGVFIGFGLFYCYEHYTAADAYHAAHKLDRAQQAARHAMSN